MSIIIITSFSPEEQNLESDEKSFIFFHGPAFLGFHNSIFFINLSTVDGPTFILNFSFTSCAI